MSADQIYAKVIADSIYAGGPRLTSFEVRFNRFVLAEVNTHRTFSRNSASSRAIPLRKQLAKVQSAPAMPVVWPAEQKGMQGGEETDDLIAAGIPVWRHAADEAAKAAALLGKANVHKSVVNRLLEPFLMHTAIITATAYDNFFMLRLDPLAQPEFRVAAEAMKAAYDASTPVELEMGQWHLPYLREGEEAEIRKEGFDPRHISSARCARTSYETQGGVRDLTEDVRLYGNLTVNGHASPLEHVATPSPENSHQVEIQAFDLDVMDVVGTKVVTLPKYGNLLGYHQHRFDVEVARDYQSFI
jgi:thymidylate synthase ThyX